MLFTTRRAVTTALNTSLLSVTAAADIVSSTLLTIDKGIHWCSSQIDNNMSIEAKASWLEHEANLRGFSSADKWKKYNEIMAAKAVAEEDAEINNLSKEQPKEKKATKTTKSGS